MKNKTKYDVAISFAEEDRNIAAALDCAFELRGLKAYYYPESGNETIGQNLHERLPVLYRDEAKYAVVILSKTYLEKKFCQVELSAIKERLEQEKGCYLVLVKTDETSPKSIGLSNDFTYVEWKFNPRDIAASIQKLLGKGKKKKKKSKKDKKSKTNKWSSSTYNAGNDVKVMKGVKGKNISL